MPKRTPRKKPRLIGQADRSGVPPLPGRFFAAGTSLPFSSRSPKQTAKGRREGACRGRAGRDRERAGLPGGCKCSRCRERGRHIRADSQPGCVAADARCGHRPPQLNFPSTLSRRIPTATTFPTSPLFPSFHLPHFVAPRHPGFIASWLSNPLMFGSEGDGRAGDGSIT
jgi:hypothetical protein